jgi:hypothetical protein
MIEFHQSDLIDVDRRKMRNDFLWFAAFAMPFAGVFIYCVLMSVPL